MEPSGALTRLPGSPFDAPGGGSIELLEVPERPGRYRLELDLALAGAAWFGEWIGEPLAERTVDLEGAG